MCFEGVSIRPSLPLDHALSDAIAFNAISSASAAIMS